MKLSTLCITALTFIPSFISATPDDEVASRKEILAKRGGEVNYLANCVNTNITPNRSTYHVSHIAWYSNVDNSLSGDDSPESLSNEYRDWAAGGDYLHWEGQQQNIYFAGSGVTVQTHIDADAQSRAFTAGAGWAQRTSDGKIFNCFKDNGRILFDVMRGAGGGGIARLVCHGVYWCV